MPGAEPAKDPNADVAGLRYEEARDELVAVVARLEAGVGSLEESLALWERGEALAARCQQWLDGARARLADAQQRQGAAPDGGARPARVDAGTGPGPDGGPDGEEHGDDPSAAGLDEEEDER